METLTGVGSATVAPYRRDFAVAPSLTDPQRQLRDKKRDTSKRGSDMGATDMSDRAPKGVSDTGATGCATGRLDLRRESMLIGDSFTQLLGVTPDDVKRLWALAVEEHGVAWIRSLHQAADRSDSVDVYVTDDRLSLWLGEAQLARLARLTR